MSIDKDYRAGCTPFEMVHDVMTFVVVQHGFLVAVCIPGQIVNRSHFNSSLSRVNPSPQLSQTSAPLLVQASPVAGLPFGHVHVFEEDVGERAVLLSFMADATVFDICKSLRAEAVFARSDSCSDKLAAGSARRAVVGSGASGSMLSVQGVQPSSVF